MTLQSLPAKVAKGSKAWNGFQVVTQLTLAHIFMYLVQTKYLIGSFLNGYRFQGMNYPLVLKLPGPI